MRLMTGHDIGADLCRALNLPKYTTDFTLCVRANDVVSVECTYYVEGDSRNLVAALAQYGLVPREVPKEAGEQPAFDFDEWMRVRAERAHSAFMRHDCGRDYGNGMTLAHVQAPQSVESTDRLIAEMRSLTDAIGRLRQDMEAMSASGVAKPSDYS